jgi:branched-chain amino acid transport system permease protein
MPSATPASSSSRPVFALGETHGVRTIEGPVVGVLLLWGLVFYLAQYGSLYLLVLGVIAILIMLLMPKGIWGTAAQRWNWRLFPTQRRLLRDA